MNRNSHRVYFFRFFSFSWLWSLRTVVLYSSAISIETRTILCGSFQKKTFQVLFVYAMIWCPLYQDATGILFFQVGCAHVPNANPHMYTHTQKKIVSTGAIPTAKPYPKMTKASHVRNFRLLSLVWSTAAAVRRGNI